MVGCFQLNLDLKVSRELQLPIRGLIQLTLMDRYLFFKPLEFIFLFNFLLFSHVHTSVPP